MLPYVAGLSHAALAVPSSVRRHRWRDVRVARGSDRNSRAEPIRDAVVHPICWLGLGVRVVLNLAEVHGS